MPECNVGCCVLGRRGGLLEQSVAKWLLLTKRLLRLVRAELVGHAMVLLLNSSLQAASTFVEQGVVLRLVLVAGLLLTLPLVVTDAQLIVNVEFRGDPENIGGTLWRSLATSLSTTRLLTVAVVSGHRAHHFLEPGFSKGGLNPRPVGPLETGVLPTLQEFMRDGQDAWKIQHVVHGRHLSKKAQFVSKFGVKIVLICLHESLPNEAVYELQKSQLFV